MKKCLLLIACVALLLPVVLLAMNAQLLSAGGQSVAAAGDCPSETMLGSWNGGHSTNTSICYNGGASDKALTSQTGVDIGASYGETDDGVRVDADNEYIRWAISADDLLDDQEGTCWIRTKLSGASGANMYIWTAEFDIDNVLGVRVNSGGGAITAYYRASATSDTKNSSGGPTTGSFIDIGFTWSISTGTGALCVDLEGGGWECDNNEALDTWDTVPDYLYLGEVNGPGGGDGGINIDIDKIRCLQGYQQGKPSPWN